MAHQYSNFACRTAGARVSEGPLLAVFAPQAPAARGALLLGANPRRVGLAHAFSGAVAGRGDHCLWTPVQRQLHPSR